MTTQQFIQACEQAISLEQTLGDFTRANELSVETEIAIWSLNVEGKSIDEVSQACSWELQFSVDLARRKNA